MSDVLKPDRTRLKSSFTAWQRQRKILEACRVGPGDKRTTAAPAFRIEDHFPELAKRSATTVRLHPRYGDEPAVDASKLGGMFLWPEDEPWPSCPHHQIPLVTVLQLRANDFPEMPFKRGTDLFQLLWCPREHFDIPEIREQPSPMYWADPRFYWRKSSKITRRLLPNPEPREAYFEYVPFPCRLLLERVLEFPSVYELPERLVLCQTKILG
jgi:hypothetical protein